MLCVSCVWLYQGQEELIFSPLTHVTTLVVSLCLLLVHTVAANGMLGKGWWHVLGIKGIRVLKCLSDMLAVKSFVSFRGWSVSFNCLQRNTAGWLWIVIVWDAEKFFLAHSEVCFVYSEKSLQITYYNFPIIINLWGTISDTDLVLVFSERSASQPWQ